MALTVAAALLASCAQIPSSGPIEQGEEVRASVDDPLIRVLPHPPQPGDSPAELVRGFLLAEASFADDHGVARQYLTEEASQAWNPDAGAVVYDDDPGPSLKRMGRDVKLTAHEVAFIGSDGSLKLRSGQLLEDNFVVRRDGGEWRIAKLSNGLYLTRLDVARTYRAFSLHFFAPNQDRLVPDPVFVPVDQPGAATSLVRSLLDGPTRWLAPAVQTAFPAGTELVVDSVPIENGVALVDLSAEVLDADDTDRERLAAQLVWTLTELPDVTEVQLTVEGAPLQLPNQPLVQSEETWEEFDPNRLPDSPTGLMVRQGIVREIHGKGSTPILGPLGDGTFLAREPAISADGGLVAALSPDGSTAVSEERFVPTDLRTVFRGHDLAAPSIDGDGEIWLADRVEGGTTIWMRPREEAVQRVAAPELRHRHVLAIRTALDGARVAVLVRGPGGQGQLLMGRVVKGEGTVALQALRPLEDSLTDIRDVVWSSADTLVGLGRRRGSVQQPFQIGIDGSIVEVAGTTLQGIDRLAAAPGVALLAATDDGQIWENRGVSWQPLLRGRDPAYPG
jgi:hypothetical protein